MIISRPIKIIVERIVVCEDVQDSFSHTNEVMADYYRGKIDGFESSLNFLGLDDEQIHYLVKIERQRREDGGEVSEC